MRGYEDRVLLMVNTSAKCRCTPQYEGLQRLHRTYGDQGLEILEFPCGQFGGGGETGPERTTRFRSDDYGITSGQFAMTGVCGEEGSDPFRCTAENGGTPVTWNFFKFLFDREGVLRGSYGSSVTPDEPEKDIVPLLRSSPGLSGGHSFAVISALCMHLVSTE